MEDSNRRWINAIAFCLAYDEYGKANEKEIGEFRHLAEWALTPSDEAQKKTPPPEGHDRQISLVTGGATKIKSYVFESARLPEIRGASGLLDRINLTDVPSLFGILESENGDEERKNHARRVREAFQKRTGKESLSCPDCIVYANGGEIVAFAPTILAPELADEIELIYTRETLVAQSVAVYCNFTLAELRDGFRIEGERDEAAFKELVGYAPAQKKSFGNLIADLARAKFCRREANKDEGRGLEYRLIPHLETSPFMRRCSSCERRGAVVVAPIAGESHALCEACARKRAFGQWTKSGTEEAIQWSSGLRWEPEAVRSWGEEFKAHYPEIAMINPPKDLNDIGEASEPEGFIGVVYADGNNMSALLENLHTPAEYRDFAIQVYDVTKAAVFDALKAHPGKSSKHMFEILSIGGDDFFLIVPAHVALPIACEIASKVEADLLNDVEFKLDLNYEWKQVQRCRQESRELTGPQSKVSLSVGVVIADAHTPVFYLQELAGQLLKSAKQRAKWLKRHHGYCGGTIDFLALKSVTMISGSVDEFRRSALTRLNHGLHLYARPYTIAEIKAMLESIRCLKSAGFPRTQLHRLSESLQKNWISSIVDYLYFLSRDKSVRQARGRIEKLWTPDSQITVKTAPMRTGEEVVIHPDLHHPWRRHRYEGNRKNGDANRPLEFLETIWCDLAELYDFVPEEKDK